MLQSEILSIMIFFMLSIGIIVLIIGLVFMKDKTNKDLNLSKKKQTDMENELETQINEADKMLQELNQFSSYIKSELENKHKELLFLYQLIDEKSQHLSFSNKVNKEKVNIKQKETNTDNNTEASKILNNKNYNNILKLHNEGYNITDIAKKLKIGKGEVELILGLAKMR